MAPEISLNRDFRCEYGKVEAVSPLVRRIVAANSGPFTFTGTGTYIIGHGRIAIIDPGPMMADHIDALIELCRGEEATHILVTHTHRDHSPASVPLSAATGAPVLGFGPHGAAGKAVDGIEEGADRGFHPDRTLADGDLIEGDGWTLEAVHTPGHTSNHLCYGLAGEAALFTGDHVMGWSTSVISPPDGDMADYMASLEKLLGREDKIYFPTHGAPITDPKPHVRAFIAHRLAREAEILACLADDIGHIPDMVRRIYRDLPEALHGAAAHSTLAHLIHLVKSGRARAAGMLTVDGEFMPN